MHLRTVRHSGPAAELEVGDNLVGSVRCEAEASSKRFVLHIGELLEIGGPIEGPDPDRWEGIAFNGWRRQIAPPHGSEASDWTVARRYEQLDHGVLPVVDAYVELGKG